MTLFIVLFSVLPTFLAVHAQLPRTTEPPSPFCQPKLCPTGKKHVACEKDSSQGPTCPVKNLRLMNVTEHSERIVKLHNEARALLTSGKNFSLPRAARVVAMQWSGELASLAEFNVKMCKEEHDECHNSITFPQSGQNILVINMTHKMEEKMLDRVLAELLEMSTKTWWSEYANMTAVLLERYPCDPKEQKLYRHFSVMALESNSHVGCAGAEYMVNNITQFRLTCNYARTPVCGTPVYRFRSVGCKSRSKKHSSLCSPQESFDL
ncbi:hypothetical protein KR018_007456 [Drosophila ironensis]|nr:hypothetical protein KR018_007456 [Drosophila ironensis]